jgi:hypothetical protein
MTARPLSATAAGGRTRDLDPGLDVNESDMARHLRLREAVFAALEGLEVEGVPVASLVEEALDIDCAAGTLRDPRPVGPTLRAQPAALALLPWIDRARGRRRAWPRPVSPGRVLIDVASTGHNCRRIWEPVARRLGPERVVLLVPARAARDRMEDFEWRSPARFPVDWSRWRAQVRSGYADWVARARGVFPHGVTERGARRLAGTIALQTLRVHEARAVVDFYRPSALLSLADRGASGAPLVGAARQRGVPTLTIAHCPVGRTFGRTFLPLIADRLLVWGDYQRDVFEELGVAADRIAVVGCPGVDAASPAPPREAAGRHLRALGVPDRPRRVLVVTGPMRDEWRAAWFGEVAGAAGELRDVAFVVRVHPSEQAAFYRDLAGPLDNVAVLENAEAGLEETLSAVDAVVVHGSSLGLDALVHGKELFVLDCLPFTLGTMREIVHAGAAVHVGSGLELAAALRQAGNESAGREARRAAARAFVEGFLAAYGDEAAQRVVAEIERIASSRVC